MSLPDVLVDTNVVSFLLRPCREGREYARHLISRAPAIAAMSLAELRFGALKDGWSDARWQRLEGLIAGWTVIPGHAVVAWEAAKIMNIRRRAGRRIEWADAWIAATAMTHGLPLVTHDWDLFEIDGLQVITDLGVLQVREPELRFGSVVEVTAADALHWAQRYVTELESAQRDSSRATAR